MLSLWSQKAEVVQNERNQGPQMSYLSAHTGHFLWMTWILELSPENRFKSCGESFLRIRF